MSQESAVVSRALDQDYSINRCDCGMKPRLTSVSGRMSMEQDQVTADEISRRSWAPLWGGSIPVPSSGWGSAGVAVGTRGVAAWRVLDAQFYGVPQRRRRVFVLGSRTLRIRPEEILLEPESVRWNSPTSRAARQSLATGVAVRTRGNSGERLSTGWDAQRFRLHESEGFITIVNG